MSCRNCPHWWDRSLSRWQLFMISLSNLTPLSYAVCTNPDCKPIGNNGCSDHLCDCPSVPRHHLSGRAIRIGVTYKNHFCWIFVKLLFRFNQSSLAPSAGIKFCTLRFWSFTPFCQLMFRGLKSRNMKIRPAWRRQRQRVWAACLRESCNYLCITVTVIDS